MTDTLASGPDTRLWAVQAAGRTITPGNDLVMQVPSGQAVTLQDVIVDAPKADAATYRFRYLAPAIARDGGTMTFATSIDDMQHLCDTYALQHLATPLPAKVQVVISFADQAVPFGEANPDATQFFVGFTVTAGACVMDPF